MDVLVDVGFRVLLDRLLNFFGVRHDELMLCFDVGYFGVGDCGDLGNEGLGEKGCLICTRTTCVYLTQ